MHQFANANHAFMLGHDFGNFGIVTKNMHTAENRQMRQDNAIFANRIRNRNAMFEMRKLVIFDTMSGRDMHKTGALFGGHMASCQKRHVKIIAMPRHWMGGDRPCHFTTHHMRANFGFAGTNRSDHGIGKIIGNHHNIALAA